MNKRTKIWTYGVAYLSLAVGAGVSIAGNVADTYRTSLAVEHVPDSLDITISAFWPAAVLLAIEMFVSRLWPRSGAMQAIRWAGSLGIGFVAMYSSWHHLSDLLASRGQDGTVATLGPLAIDGLAIMATGLILSSRGHKIEDTVTVAMDNSMATFAPYVSTPDTLPSWLDGLADRVDSTTTPAVPLDIIPVSGAGRGSNEIKPESVPAEARDALLAWRDSTSLDRPSPGQRNELVAAAYGVSTRTARRWFDAVKPRNEA